MVYSNGGLNQMRAGVSIIYLTFIISTFCKSFMLCNCNIQCLLRLWLQICDMVVIARYLNVTFVVPELDNTSFWQDRR